MIHDDDWEDPLSTDFQKLPVILRDKSKFADPNPINYVG